MQFMIVSISHDCLSMRVFFLSHRSEGTCWILLTHSIGDMPYSIFFSVRINCWIFKVDSNTLLCGSAQEKLLFSYLPPVQTECMRRCVTPLKE